jgi:hypothetical protein
VRWLEGRAIRPWLLVFVACLVGVALNVTAPGNGVRAGFSGEPSLVVGMKWAQWQMRHYLPRWILSVPFLALLVAIIGSGRRHVPCRWLIPVLTGLAVAAVFILPASAQLTPAAGRVVNVAYLIALLGLLWTAQAYAPTTPRPRVQTVALACCAASLLITGNTMKAGQDLLNRVRPWHQDRHARYEALKARPGGDVVVPKPPTVPRLFWSLDITPDPANYRNLCLAGYSGVRSVRIGDRPPGR